MYCMHIIMHTLQMRYADEQAWQNVQRQRHKVHVNSIDTGESFARNAEDADDMALWNNICVDCAAMAAACGEPIFVLDHLEGTAYRVTAQLRATVGRLEGAVTQGTTTVTINGLSGIRAGNMCWRHCVINSVRPEVDEINGVKATRRWRRSSAAKKRDWYTVKGANGKNYDVASTEIQTRNRNDIHNGDRNVSEHLRNGD